jgi:TRAP transporter TAXI family solute receptor
VKPSHLGSFFAPCSAVLIAALAAGSAPACRSGAAPAPASVQAPVRFTTGPPGGGFYPFGESLARAYREALPAITVETHPSAGAVANVQALQAGDADLGFAFADVAYLAFAGQLVGQRAPFDRLRGIAVLQVTPVQLVARASSNITTVAGLRGHSVGIGFPGTGTALAAELILRAFGIAPPDVRIERLEFNEASRDVVAGTLDAMFGDVNYPADSITMATRAGARLLPLAGKPVERLRRDYPFFRPAIIPRGSYPGVVSSIHTIGIDSLLICRKDLAEPLVYSLTKQLFDAMPSLSSSFSALRFVDLHRFPATPIPLHDGAARFYRERELGR